MSFKTTPNRKFMVINEKGEHEYSIIVSEATTYGRTYQLLSSNNLIWSEDHRGNLLLVMTDTGNGIEFDRDIKFIGYDIAVYVRLLLTFDSKTFSSFENKFKIIEENAILEI